MKNIVQDDFRQKGVPDDYLPKLRINNTHIGSFELEVFIYIGKSLIDVIRYCDTILKSPQIIKDIKNIGPKIQSRLEKIIPPMLGEDVFDLYINIIIDNCVEESLANFDMKSHSLLIKVDVSKNFLTLANHGEKEIANIRLGAFKSKIKRAELDYANSYQAFIRFLRPQNPISLEIRELKKSDGTSLNLTNYPTIYFCCWLRDIHGIYILKFYFKNYDHISADSILDSRRIYLKARISRNFLHIKNLSGLDIKNLRLGLFKRDDQKDSWDFRESYQNRVKLLSRNTELDLDINDFKDSKDNSLDLSDYKPVRIDCWVENVDGTYIFQFAI
jgi:hypothetical protein